MQNTIKDIMDVYNMLEDNESRDIYLKRLNYLITGNDNYIAEIVKTYLPHLWPEESMRKLLNLLPKDRAFVMYGAGWEGRRLLRFVQGDRRFIGFCSRTKSKQENGYRGYPVMSPEELLRRKDVSVIISTHKWRDDIAKVLRDGNYPENLIFDGTSYYTIIEEDNQYFNPDFIKFGDNEIFIDAGCYDLFTSICFKQYCKGVKKVYAFEPDPQNYERCIARKKEVGFEEAKIFPFGTWSKKETLRFSATGTGSASLGAPDGIPVPVVPVDDMIDDGDKVTMIKMDVEGAELESLKGARQIILRDKPSGPSS